MQLMMQYTSACYQTQGSCSRSIKFGPDQDECFFVITEENGVLVLFVVSATCYMLRILSIRQLLTICACFCTVYCLWKARS